MGFDLVNPPEIPQGFEFVKVDILQLGAMRGRIGVKAQMIGFLHSWEGDFVCCSTPCEEFSIQRMKNFHPNPPTPEMGIKLFNHARTVCDDSGLPYVMENVGAAEDYVGQAVNRCGPFHLWGNAVPPLLVQGVKKAQDLKAKYPPTKEMLRRGTKVEMFHVRSSMPHKIRAALVAEIPPELARCVVDYAETICHVHS